MLYRRNFLMGISTLLLAGCVQTKSLPINAPDFSDLNKLSLAVGVVTVEPLHNDKDSYPHIEGLSPFPLQTIIRQWSDEVFQPKGGIGTLNIQINSASLIEEKLKTTGGIQGLFRNDQSESYNGMIQLTFQATFPDYTGTIEIQSVSKRTVSQNITYRDRQQVWVDMGVNMVREIDTKLRKSILDKMPRLILAR